MSEPAKIAIGIQARSTSDRLPGKVFELIGGKPMLSHVLESANRSAEYINRYTNSSGMSVEVYILCPTGDEVKKRYAGKCKIIEGSELDVLSRYKLLLDQSKADYIVRLTSDCPLLPAPLITKAIKTAVKNKYDYISNVDERLRTAADGFDVEVISKRMLAYASDNAIDPKDREHVTTFIRKYRPEWAQDGHIIGYLFLANVKLSVDTKEDLERVREEFEKRKKAKDLAEKLSGRHNVHLF